MRLNVLATSALAAGVAARSNAFVERELNERDLLLVGPGGSVCPAIPTTVIVLQPIFVPNATTTSFITTTTTVFPGQITTTSNSVATTTSASAYTPPFTIGEGLPSGVVTNLPFEQFFFLGYSTPGAAASPVAKRDNELDRRQVRVQTTASPITLVDISVPTPAAPALGATVCDNATPLNLVNGVLNGKGFSVGKLLGATDAVLGALINPPENQVNLTFSIQNGLLIWASPDAGGASFYDCTGTIFAGFPNLNIAGCNQVIVGPIAGALCTQYVTSTRTVNPTFTAPLTSSSSSTVTGSTTATASSVTASTTSGSSSSQSTSTGTDSTASTSSGSSSSASSDSSSTSAGSSSSASSMTGTSTGTSSDSSSLTTTTSTTTSSAATGTATCLVVLPNACLTGLAGITDLTQIIAGASSCANVLLPQLSLAGTVQATDCLVNGLVQLGVTGDSVLGCLSSRVLCGSGGTATGSAPSATGTGILGLPVCLPVLPQVCVSGLTNAVGLSLLTGAQQCTNGLDGLLDISGLTTATTCLVQAVTGVLNGLNGNSILTCLSNAILCPSTTSTTAGGSATTSAPATTTTAGLLCLPTTLLPAVCTALNSFPIAGTAVVQAGLCTTALTPLLAGRGLSTTVVTDTLFCLTQTGLTGPQILDCLSTAGGVCT